MVAEESKVRLGKRFRPLGNRKKTLTTALVLEFHWRVKVLVAQTGATTLALPQRIGFPADFGHRSQ